MLFTGESNTLKDIVKTLRDTGVLLDHFSFGSSKWMGMGVVATVARRIDLMWVPRAEYPFALMYFTGSKEFNESFRGHAKRLGFTLNEHGITRVDGKNVTQRFLTEQDIFTFLKTEYIPPNKRVSFSQSASIPQSALNKSAYNVSTGVMLADVFKKDTDPRGMLASEKYDGIRAIWDGRTLRSRTNKQFYAPSWFIERLPADVALDGELHMGRTRFQNTASTVMKKTPVNSEWHEVEYVLFDLPTTAKTPFHERIASLQRVVKKIGARHVIAAEHTTILNREHMDSLYSNVLKQDGEGLMLRVPDGIYVPRRSKLLLKVKPTDDAEAVIIGSVEGKGKDSGSLGAFKVQLVSKPEIEFKIGTGFTAKQRRELWKNRPTLQNTVVTFSHKGHTRAGIPRHPAFMRIRNNI